MVDLLGGGPRLLDRPNKSDAIAARFAQIAVGAALAHLDRQMSINTETPGTCSNRAQLEAQSEIANGSGASNQYHDALEQLEAISASFAQSLMQMLSSGIGLIAGLVGMVFGSCAGGGCGG
jgi:hypothetical protein